MFHSVTIVDLTTMYTFCASHINTFFTFQGYHDLLSRQHADQEELSNQLDEQDVRKMEQLEKVWSLLFVADLMVVDDC